MDLSEAIVTISGQVILILPVETDYLTMGGDLTLD